MCEYITCVFIVGFNVYRFLNTHRACFIFKFSALFQNFSKQIVMPPQNAV